MKESLALLVGRTPFACVIAVTAALGGCVADGTIAGSSGSDDGSNTGSNTGSSNTSALFAVMDSPRHGEVDSDPVESASLAFHGYASASGAAIDLQLLADPGDATSWTTMTRVIASSSAEQFGGSETL